MTGSPPLGEELERVFSDGLSHLRGTLAPPADDRPFQPAGELLSGEALPEVVDRFRRSRGGDADRRAAASLWSQWYFGTLAPPAMAASLLLGRDLPLGAREVGILLDEETGRPLAFRLPHEGTIAPDATAFDRFRGLVWGHAEPLVARLAPLAGLSRDTLWTNLGRYVQWILDEMDRPEAEAGRPLLEADRWPDGRENPLRDTIRYVESGGRRLARRRVCCLQYLLPDLEGCGDLCPLPQVRGEGGAGR